MILAIDTVSDKKSVSLYWPEKIQKTISWKKEKLSPLEKIDELLAHNKLSKKDIKLIVVNRGPGSFTGIRLGISIANTLSYSLATPVIGIVNKNGADILTLAKEAFRNRSKAKIGIISPYYGKEPNITRAKDRKISKI